MAAKADNEHLIRLGKVAANGAALEAVVTKVLAWSLEVKDEVAGMVASQLMLMDTLNLIDALAKRDDYPLAEGAVRKWVKLTRKAVEARNRAIHDVWVADSDGGDLTKVLRKGRLEEPPLDLVATIELLLTALHAGHALTPQRPNPKDVPG